MMFVIVVDMLNPNMTLSHILIYFIHLIMSVTDALFIRNISIITQIDISINKGLYTSKISIINQRPFTFIENPFSRLIKMNIDNTF